MKHAEALLIVLSGADALAAFAPIHCPGKAGPGRLECLGLSSDTYKADPRATGSRERGTRACSLAGGEPDSLVARGSPAVGWRGAARRSVAVGGVVLKPTVSTDGRQDSEVAADDVLLRSPPVLGGVVAVLASLLFARVKELQRFCAHKPTLMVHHAKTLARLCITSVGWLFFESLRALRTSELVKQGHVQLRAKRSLEAGSVAAGRGGTRPVSSQPWRPRPVSPQSWSGTRPVPILPRHATANVPATLAVAPGKTSCK